MLPVVLVLTFNTVDVPFHKVTLTLPLNPFGNVDVVPCPLISLVKINRLGRTQLCYYLSVLVQL